MLSAKSTITELCVFAEWATLVIRTISAKSRDAKATQNVLSLKHASIENVLTLAHWKDVESMLSALPKITGLFALVRQDTDQTLILTSDASSMSA